MARTLALPLLLAAGCYGGATLELATAETLGEKPVDAPVIPDDPPRPVAGPSDAALPCDVAALLASRCQSCHSSPPHGAPMPLVSHADLSAPAASDPGRRVADVALTRMKATAGPMPPSGATQAEIATLEAWVSAGLPKGSCGATVPASPPAPVTCSSGSWWTVDRQASSLMHPGRACAACHGSEPGAPVLSIAGTIYPALHETDDCYGDKAVTVEITDAAGRLVRLTSNDYGNFLSNATLTMPIRARVLFDGRVREMAGAQPTGDCNACHTEQGASGAPGRILRP